MGKQLYRFRFEGHFEHDDSEDSLIAAINKRKEVAKFIGERGGVITKSTANVVAAKTQVKADGAKT